MFSKYQIQPKYHEIYLKYFYSLKLSIFIWTFNPNWFESPQYISRELGQHETAQLLIAYIPSSNSDVLATADSEDMALT